MTIRRGDRVHFRGKRRLYYVRQVHPRAGWLTLAHDILGDIRYPIEAFELANM